MVRLKPGSTSNDRTKYSFQFLNGSIKAELSKYTLEGSRLFQFLNGSIKAS